MDSTNAVNTSTKGRVWSLERWFNPHSIANVLLLKTMKEKYSLRYYSHDRGGVFKVYTRAAWLNFCHLKRLALPRSK